MVLRRNKAIARILVSWRLLMRRMKVIDFHPVAMRKVSFVRLLLYHAVIHIRDCEIVALVVDIK